MPKNKEALMVLAIRYIKYSFVGSSNAICFIIIAYCVLSPGSFFSKEKLYINQIFYYGLLGAIFGVVFLSLQVLINKVKPKLLILSTSLIFQVIGILSALVTVSPAIAITIIESDFPLVNEFRSVSIFLLAHLFIGWFVGMILGKTNEINA
jgi:hypothetical protein